jgi:C4-dicarboxylate-specific signal transduction histidine kinase
MNKGIPELESYTELYRLAEIGKHAAHLCHDLAGPLAAIQLNLEDTEQTEKIERARASLERMAASLQSVRSYSALAREKSVFDMAEQLHKAASVVHDKAWGSGVEITMHTNQVNAFGNPLIFQQVVINLILNAIDAYVSHGRTGIVELRLTSQEHTSTLDVTDNAGGMYPEVADQIFQPFFTTKAHIGGMGMGLSLCKEMVENDLGGTISLETVPKKGSRFRLCLPQV